MRRHLKALAWAMIVLVAGFILTVIKGWYILTYGLVATAIVYGFVYAINVSRFDGQPSYEDQEDDEDDDRARRAK